MLVMNGVIIGVISSSLASLLFVEQHEADPIARSMQLI